MEQKILASCLASRDVYDTVSAHANLEAFSVEGKTLIEMIEEYYENDPEATQVDRDILKARAEHRFSNPKHVQRFQGIIDSLPTDVSIENVRKDVVALKRHEVGNKLAVMLSMSPDDEDVKALMDSYLMLVEEENGEAESAMQGVHFRELFEGKLSSENLIPLFPPVLNDACDGGALPGHHILIYGPSDMGKSLLAIAMMGFWARQGKKVLFLENEEPIEFTIARLASCMTGLTKQEIKNDLDRAYNLAVERGYNNVIMQNVTPGTPREIESLVKKHRPDILIYNQIRNMAIKGDNRTNQLEKAATEMRRIAKTHNILIVSITQAADSASNKLILELGDVDSSNVGIPGQCDLMIGIGANKEFLARGSRMLSLAKNKLSPVQGSHFEVKFNTFLSRVERP